MTKLKKFILYYKTNINFWKKFARLRIFIRLLILGGTLIIYSWSDHNSWASNVTIFCYHYYKHYHNSIYACQPAADSLPTCYLLAVFYHLHIIIMVTKYGEIGYWIHMMKFIGLLPILPRTKCHCHQYQNDQNHFCLVNDPDLQIVQIAPEKKFLKYILERKSRRVNFHFILEGC